MTRDWNIWPPPSRHENGHSTKEIEHRFTAIEEFSKQSQVDRDHLNQIVERHAAKLSTHERAILAICIALGVVLQDKFPALAKLLLKSAI
jgi:hypothetical protein